MVFEEVKRPRGGATITLWKRRGGRLPHAVITLRVDIAARLTDWGSLGTEIALQIGRDADAGKIRLVAKRHGGHRLRRIGRGALQVPLGHRPEWGTATRPREEADARVIDAATVEIDLPTWAAMPAVAERAEQAAKTLAVEARVASASQNAPAGTAGPKRLPPAPQLPPTLKE